MNFFLIVGFNLHMTPLKKSNYLYLIQPIHSLFFYENFLFQVMHTNKITRLNPTNAFKI
jgi:hypothetical protein